MPNLEERLRTLDTIESPDLWPEIGSGRSPRPPQPEPGARRRFAATGVSLVLLVLIGIILSRSLPGTPGTTATGKVGPGMGHGGPFPLPIEVSAVTPDGSARCTATFPSASLQPGEPVGVTVSLVNLGSEGIEYDQFHSVANLVVKDANGAVLWDSFSSSARLRGGLGHATLHPGERVALRTWDEPIRWPGVLTVVTFCPAAENSLELPPVALHVAVPGPTPDAAAALDDALAKTGGVFDECRPLANGPPTVGVIQAKFGRTVLPMEARCMADVEENPGFDVVTLTFEAPPDGPSVDIPDDIFRTKLPGSDPLEVGRWVFLVTDESAKEISPLQSIGRSCRGGFVLGGITFIACSR